MAKRFTATDKWEDAWFCSLTSDQKLFWIYLLDKCDNAGIWEKNYRVASFFLGFDINDQFIAYLDDRIVPINGSKWFIPKFIQFQYGELSESCKPHIPVIKQLEKYNLKGYAKGIHTLKEKEKEKDKEKEKEKDIYRSDKILHPLQKIVKSDFPHVAKLPDQLTYKQAEKLEKLGEGVAIKILRNMQNYKPLLSKSRSVYYTVLNWYERDKKQPTGYDNKITSRYTQEDEELRFGKSIEG